MKRIIVIDDDEAILRDYMLILSPPEKDISGLEAQAAALEAELFGEPPREHEESDSREQYELTTALQGEEGLRKIQEAERQGRPFALAFIDVRMPPGWDGVETARRIREADRNIEIVIVTAYSDRERREIVAEVGTPEKLLYLKKPFDPDEIRQLALSLTRKWSLERRAERHRTYLERLLFAVRRLKTLSLSSVRGVLSAILSEVLYLSDARKGFIARLDNSRVEMEIVSENLSEAEAEMLIGKISPRLPKIADITQVNGIIVFPLKDIIGNLFVLVMDRHFPLPEERLKLLKLLLETSSEVLESFRKQEQYLRSEKIATIGQIAAGIIHEINNPLTAIVGASELSGFQADRMWQVFDAYEEMFRDGKIPPDLKERRAAVRDQIKPGELRRQMTANQSIVQNGVERVRGLMANIRNFSKVSDTFEPKPADVGKALEDTLMLAHNSLKYAVKVHKNWPSPLMARCDINGLKQVFLNLILNAVQAMEGSGELWITALRKNGKIRISVRDSGPGIPETEREKIFNAFYTTKDTGTGLGLSIVRGIISKHNGSVRVESQTGQGTVFYIEIPSE